MKAKTEFLLAAEMEVTVNFGAHHCPTLMIVLLIMCPVAPLRWHHVPSGAARMLCVHWHCSPGCKRHSGPALSSKPCLPAPPLTAGYSWETATAEVTADSFKTRVSTDMPMIASKEQCARSSILLQVRGGMLLK